MREKDSNKKEEAILLYTLFVNNCQLYYDFEDRLFWGKNAYFYIIDKKVKFDPHFWMSNINM